MSGKNGFSRLISMILWSIKGELQMSNYERLLDKLENGTPEQKIDAELEIMGRWYYLND